MPRFVGLVALALSALAGGCFSAADFSPCTGPGECGLDADGRGRICVDGECIAPGLETGDDPVVLAGTYADLQSYPDQTVIIRAVRLGGPVLRVEADAIVIEGPIDGFAAGYVGGEGGQYGAVGSPGESGAMGEPRREGSGGPGGAGGPSRWADGAPGGGGVLSAACGEAIDFSFLLSGSGGGGGGGGAGGNICRGTSGGMGGRGGGALLLKARRFIEVRGTIVMGGEPGATPDLLPCEDDREDGPGGKGGVGGSGSGGLIYFEAPTVVFSEGTSIDAAGGRPGSTDQGGDPGGSQGGGGLVAIAGTVEGLFTAPLGVEPHRICRLPPR